jgi:hypothetical protein
MKRQIHLPLLSLALFAALVSCSSDPAVVKQGLGGVVNIPASFLPLPPNTKVSIYAEVLKAGCPPNASTTNNACYDGANAQSATLVVPLNNSSSVSYNLVNNQAGTPLSARTYRVIACVNKNANGISCDSGDLYGIYPSSIKYEGSPILNLDFPLSLLN